MNNYLGLLIADAKEFLCNETNRVFIAVILVGVLVCYSQCRTENILRSVQNINAQNHKELLAEIKTNRNKIHFRYFNLTRSLEDIHKVKIDTKNGRIEK